MGHSYNHGLVTSSRGVAIEMVSVSFAAAGAPTLVDGGKAGLIASVAKTSDGLYTFTLAKPYPRSKVAILASLSCVDKAGAIRDARYVEGSYNATAGTFQVAITGDEDSPAGVDPTASTSLDLVMFFQRYAGL